MLLRRSGTWSDPNPADSLCRIVGILGNWEVWSRFMEEISATYVSADVFEGDKCELFCAPFLKVDVGEEEPSPPATRLSFKVECLV